MINDNDEDDQPKRGVDTLPRNRKGGIHINPANKGKFNALKARTGKTTAELKNSPNPLTRKRATFAANAKQWNK